MSYTKSKVYAKANLNEFIKENSLDSLRKLVAIVMAYLESGGLFEKSKQPLRNAADDNPASRKFGDFGRLISVLKRVESTVGFEEVNTKMKDQEIALNYLGVKLRSYERFVSTLRQQGLLTLPDIIWTDELYDELLTLLFEANGIFRIVKKRSGYDKRVYDSAIDEPFHFIDESSTTLNDPNYVAGATIVFERIRENTNYCLDDNLWEMSSWEIDDGPRKKDSRTFVISLSTPVDLHDLVRLGIARYETNVEGRYDPSTDCYQEKHIVTLFGRKVHEEEIPNTGHPEAAERLAHLLANAMRNDETLAKFPRATELGVIKQLWKRFISYDTSSGRVFRTDSDAYNYFKKKFQYLLDGKTSLGEDSLDYLYPAKFSEEELAEQEVLSPGSLPQGWKEETYFFDGASLEKRISEVSKFLIEQPEYIELHLVRNHWVITKSGKLRDASMTFVDRRTVEYYKLILPSDLYVKIENGKAVVVKRPAEGISSATLETVRGIEEDRGLVANAFGLDAAMNEKLNSIVPEIIESIPKCPCCKGGDTHSISNAFNDPDFKAKLLTREGLTICTSAGAILALTERKAGFGSGWSKIVSRTSMGCLKLRGFNHKGKLVLAIVIEN